ncbi:MAG: hypothetical protein AAF485_18260 [Chloroflexota bacterium]
MSDNPTELELQEDDEFQPRRQADSSRATTPEFFDETVDEADVDATLASSSEPQLDDSLRDSSQAAWQEILWREWRNTDDELYARHLFELVADTPINNVAIGFTVLLMTFYGILAGLLLDLLIYLSGLWLFPTFFLIGGAVGYFAGTWRLYRQPKKWKRVTWRTWFSLMVPRVINQFALMSALVLTGLLISGVDWVMNGDSQIGIFALIILLAIGFGTILVTWLLAPAPKADATKVHNYRAWWRWWSTLSYRAEVETALKNSYQVNAQRTSIWPEILQELPNKLGENTPVQQSIELLKSGFWEERFLARQRLGHLAGEAVPRLQEIVTDLSSLLRWPALRLLHDIANETKVKFGEVPTRFICLRCLTRFGPHTVKVLSETITFYGCRLCQQSRDYWEGEIVAVLDGEADGKTIETDVLKVNWLIRRELFDFDRVEIRHATDEAVERFAVQIGNDTDPVRRPLYQQMVCEIKAPGQLSDNTVRILERTFGQVIV